MSRCARLSERRYEFGSLTASGPANFFPGKDGSGVIAAGGKHLAVDFSGASGAPLLLAGVGIGVGKSDGVARFRTVEAGGQTVTILTLSKDRHPDAKVEGDRIIVADQTIRLDGKRFLLAR